MAWTEFVNLGSIFLLVQICCGVTAGGNNAGIKAWNVSNSLEKNDKNIQREINDIEDAIKIDDSSLSLHASRKRNGESLRDINPEYNDESPFDDDVSVPSGLQEKLYGQSEEQQHAKMSDLHFADPGRKAFFLVPSPEGGHENRNQGDWFSKQTLEEKMGTADVMEKFEPLRVREVSRFVSPFQQRILNEPVIKVSYGLNQRNSRLHTSPPRYKQRTQGSKISAAYHSNQVRSESRATNKAVGPGSMKKGRPWSTSGVKMPLSSSKSVDITGNVRQDTIELASEGIQLQELAESVLKQLGDQGSKFVSTQLAKHPNLKNIWANIIARALMRQSIQIARLDASTKSSNLSDIAAHQPRKSIGPSNESKVNNDLPIEVNRGFQDSNSTNGLNPEKTVHQQLTAASQSNSSVSNSHSHSVSPENNIDNKDMQSVKLGTKIETPKSPVNSSAYVNEESLTTSRDDEIQFQIQGAKENENRDAQSEGRNGSIHNLESSVPQTMEGRGPLAIATKIVKDFAPNRENRKDTKQASVNQKGRERFPLKAKVHSGVNNFLQLNQMNGDPVALQDYSDFIDDPYLKQQQLLNEDGNAASYLEHKINNAGQVLSEVFPSYNDTLLKADSGEANYVVNSLQDDSTTTTQLAETLAENNKMINTENLQNSQILSAVLKEDKKIATMGNKKDVQQQQSVNSRAAHFARGKAPNMQINSRTSSPSYDNQLGNKVDKKMENEFQSDMIPNSYWGISTSDLNNIEGVNEAYDVNNWDPSYIRGVPNEGEGQTEQLYNESEAANFFPQYDATPVPGTEVQAQKKQQIRLKERYLEKRKRIKSLNKNIKSSSGSNAVVSKVKVKRVKKVENRFDVKIRPKISQNQPATRDSEITPTSVIFGLTNKDMKELEKHLAHEEHSWHGNLGPDMKSGEVKKQNKDSMEGIENKIKAHKKNNVFSNRGRPLRVFVQQNRRMERHFKPSLTFFEIRKHKSQARQKRNSTSLEAVSGPLSNGLNQLEVQDMMAGTQRSLPEETIKDYFGQRYRNFRGFRKPASGLSFYKYPTGSRSFENSVRGTKGKRGLNDESKRNEVSKGSIKHGRLGIKNRSRINELKRHTPDGRQYWSGLNIIHSSKARKLAAKRDLDEFQTEFNDGTFRSPDFERQLSQALMQENKHDLAYVGAINNVDEQGFNTMVGHPNNPGGHPKLISPKTITGASAENHRLTGLLKSSEDLSMKENQEKLLSFFRNSNRYINNDNSQTLPSIVGKNERATSNIADNKMSDFTARRKGLTLKYKELGNVGPDGQGKLTSVLRSVNSSDQRDLKELEKMDEDDEKEAQSLFTPI